MVCVREYRINFSTVSRLRSPHSRRYMSMDLAIHSWYFARLYASFLENSRRTTLPSEKEQMKTKIPISPACLSYRCCNCTLARTCTASQQKDIWISCTDYPLVGILKCLYLSVLQALWSARPADVGWVESIPQSCLKIYFSIFLHISNCGMPYV